MCIWWQVLKEKKDPGGLPGSRKKGDPGAPGTTRYPHSCSGYCPLFLFSRKPTEPVSEANYITTLPASSMKFQRDPVVGDACSRWNIVRRNQVPIIPASYAK